MLAWLSSQLAEEGVSDYSQAASHPVLSLHIAAATAISSSMQIAGIGTRGSGTCGTGTAVLGHAELGQFL